MTQADDKMRRRAIAGGVSVLMIGGVAAARAFYNVNQALAFFFLIAGLVGGWALFRFTSDKRNQIGAVDLSEDDRGGSP